ncbi:hypothetical protein F6R98_09090 [Candidatus Methylospira mobilis]|uniref:Insecticidal crystal toxin domain-containing protein n=1 Tax=Candidatus Methylospira mobilis TaxID=1808979 RepID=A0A5Q0BKW2_9GAMM|nr:hypothetical protein [Candidatus Methylospira mobilis]QFY42758.1 hypothetical protein F6R98_09090 [Candidatus Methylospira mobilis]WNV04115.1 hypothetical protein RP726_17130 [Candidatus Methylospira mobilis]
MSDKYILANYDRQYFVFRLTGHLAYDRVLEVSTALQPHHNAYYIKAGKYKPNASSQIFLVFPETIKSTDTFRIFNQNTGKAWTKLGGMIGEQDFNPDEAARSQVFNLREIASGLGPLCEFAFDGNGLYGIKTQYDEDLIGRPRNQYAFTDSIDFLAGFGGGLPPSNVGHSGSLEHLPPPLTEHAPPPPTLEPFATRVLRLPFFMIKDDERDSAWKARNSPWYYLRRQVKFISKEGWFIYNNTSTEQERSWKTTKGWSKTDSQSFSITTGMSVSASASFFGTGVTTEFSMELGYSTESSFTETYTEETEIKIKAPAKTSVVMWQGQSTFTLLRSDGSEAGRWVRNDDGLYFLELAVGEREGRYLVLNTGEEMTRQLTDQGGVSDFVPIARRSL